MHIIKLINAGDPGDHPAIDGASVDIKGRMVHLVFEAASPGDAEQIADDLARQIQSGSIRIALPKGLDANG